MLNDNILPLEEIQKALEDKRLYKVAKTSGLSYPTLRKLAKGEDLNYTLGTLKAASDYIRKSRGE